MKAKDLKQWQLFYNTNNYLCLVYKVEGGCRAGGKAHIVNYNGTFYKANRDSDYEYSNEIPEESVEQFFMNFPITKLDYKQKDVLQSIKDMYYTKQNKDLYKLLITC